MGILRGYPLSVVVVDRIYRIDWIELFFIQGVKK